MSITICPRCRERVLSARGNNDVIHACTGEETLRNEDVPVHGEWVDYTGSGGLPGVSTPNLQGLPSQNIGTDAYVLGGPTYDLTNRGKKVTTHRTRAHLEFVETLTDGR